MSPEGVYCICEEGEEKACVIPKIYDELHRAQSSKVNQELDCFKTFKETLDKKQVPTTQVEDESSWQWESKSSCNWYYVLVFDKDGLRIRKDEEIVCHGNGEGQKCETVKKSERVKRVMVLPLFKKDDNSHNKFVVIRKANDGESFILIDLLSIKKQESRTPPRRCQVYFGFRFSGCSGAIENIERVALKNEIFKPNNWQKVKCEIESAMKAGGQYNMKYWGYTHRNNCNDVWIAMELCCMETLNVLILMKSEGSYAIDGKGMKIFFRHILLGLSHLRMKGLAHGEMIMENILLSLDHKSLKIGDYDHVKQVGKTTNLSEEFEKDIIMTASMFFMCMKRDAKHNLKELVKEIPPECKDWLSTVPPRDDDTITITKTIFPHVDPNSIMELIKNTKKTNLSWPLLLKKLSEMLPNSNPHSPDQYLSAYLIMHMALDKPEPEDVLKHPFFWDQYKILCFISRLDAFLWEKQNSQIKKELKRDINDLWPDFNWWEEYQKSFDSLKKDPAKSVNAKNIVDEAEKILYHHKDTDITGFLRAIRNVHNHYHEPVKKKQNEPKENGRCFSNAFDVWNHFNKIYPGMICLLHRVIWKNKDSSTDIKDLLRFVSKYTLSLKNFADCDIPYEPDVWEGVKQ